MVRSGSRYDEPLMAVDYIEHPTDFVYITRPSLMQTYSVSVCCVWFLSFTVSHAATGRNRSMMMMMVDNYDLTQRHYQPSYRMIFRNVSDYTEDRAVSLKLHIVGVSLMRLNSREVSLRLILIQNAITSNLAWTVVLCDCCILDIANCFLSTGVNTSLSHCRRAQLLLLLLGDWACSCRCLLSLKARDGCSVRPSLSLPASATAVLPPSSAVGPGLPSDKMFWSGCTIVPRIQVHVVCLSVSLSVWQQRSHSRRLMHLCYDQPRSAIINTQRSININPTSINSIFIHWYKHPFQTDN